MGGDASAGRLSGKTCLVTGAGQGIGRAVALMFASQGAQVVAADLRFADDYPQHDAVEKAIIDATSELAAEEAAARFPDVSVLVNCVGIVPQGTILDCPAEQLSNCLDVNVGSMVQMIRAFLPGMLTRGHGSIINIASVVSSVMAAPNRFAYATSKAAVIGLTMSVARDFIERDIRCNSISPGTVDSPSLRDRFEATGNAEAARAAFIARQPMGRLGQAEEIAAIATLLASDEAGFMSGTNVVIDGGMSL